MIYRWPICAFLALGILLVPGADRQRPSAAQRSPDGPFVAMQFSNSGLHAYRSLLQHGREFTHLLPRWFHVTRLDRPPESELAPDIVGAARQQGLTVIPVMDNLDGPRVRPDVTRAMLADATRRARVISAIGAALAEHNLGGVDVDFIGLEPADDRNLGMFLTELGAAVRPSGRVVMVSVHLVGKDAEDILALSALIPLADYVHAHIYGEHTPNTNAGPGASTRFFVDALNAVSRVVPPNKLIVGLSMVGYDWPEQGTASTIDFPRAVALARARGGGIAWEAETDSLSLTYREGSQSHTAYFEDALTLSNKLGEAEARRVAGVSFLELGAEDPTLWQLLARGRRAEVIQGLSDVSDDLLFQVIGAGEVWDVASASRVPGRREFTVDPSSGRVSNVKYVQVPAPYTLDRSGVPVGGNKIAVTFDDGPSPEWTPKMLDLLAAHQVPATFFMVGRHALGNRHLVRRVVEEGHEIGSHTFNHIALGQMAPLQVTLELNATRFIIAGITGRTMRYIRSPFVANPNPYDEEPTPQPGYFLAPLLVAHQYGYLTVGNNLDPQDWARPGVGAIVERATNRQLDPPGYILLLHDSGGDRTQTLAALPLVVDSYRSQGFEFTTVSGLLSQDRDFGMPPIRPDEAFAVQFVALGFNVLQAGEDVLLFLLMLSILVGMSRTVGLLALAFAHYLKPRVEPFETQEIQPFVSVLVPAYNEEKVIGNTIESLLGSNYRNYEIIVIDDGSKDGTLVAARKFEPHPRLRVISKQNGGKSSALNHGIHLARGEVVIAMDADTVFDPNFIPYILGHFRDPNVGAASGNAKVGNREDLIASWQSIEYITSFNLDRRAYTLLNCVTVVPGAAGAWRKRDLVTAGGFGHDTLAEDADLTVNVRRLGRRIVYEDRAIAWTEAPNTAGGFVKQRRRWSYGTLQMLWKHRDVFFRPRYGALGFVAFPSAVLYLVFSLIAPAIDVGAMWSVGSQLHEELQLNRELPMTGGEILLSLFWGTGPKPLFYYGAFVMVEWVQSAIAFFMDRERPRPLLMVPVQRFALRWLLYYVLFATFITAVKGFRVGWGKLERKGSVLGSGNAPPASGRASG